MGAEMVFLGSVGLGSTGVRTTFSISLQSLSSDMAFEHSKDSCEGFSCSEVVRSQVHKTARLVCPVSSLNQPFWHIAGKWTCFLYPQDHVVSFLFRFKNGESRGFLDVGGFSMADPEI